MDDAVEANILAMERGEGKTYNIGTGMGTSVNRIFELLSEILGYKWKPTYSPARPGDVAKIILDNTKAVQELNWKPKVTLENGTRNTVDYFRNLKR